MRPAQRPGRAARSVMAAHADSWTARGAELTKVAGMRLAAGSSVIWGPGPWRSWHPRWRRTRQGGRGQEQAESPMQHLQAHVQEEQAGVRQHVQVARTTSEVGHASVSV